VSVPGRRGSVAASVDQNDPTKHVAVGDFDFPYLPSSTRLAFSDPAGFSLSGTNTHTRRESAPITGERADAVRFTGSCDSGGRCLGSIVATANSSGAGRCRADEAAAYRQNRTALPTGRPVVAVVKRQDAAVLHEKDRRLGLWQQWHALGSGIDARGGSRSNCLGPGAERSAAPPLVYDAILNLLLGIEKQL
jgi:hypothetical protein